MEQDALFCRECGTALTEQKTGHSEKTISYVDEILDRHLQHFPNEFGKEVETCVSTMAHGHYFELTIISNIDTSLKIEVSFKETSKREKEALERLKSMEFFHRFTTNITRTDGYDGYIDLSEDVNLAKSILSRLIKDVYQVKEISPIVYSIKIGGENIGQFSIKDGVHVKNKGCLSMIIALIVMGVTFLSLIQ